jgi:deoxycytidylate deaminase
VTAPPSDMVAAAVRASCNSPCRSQRGAAIFTNYRLITVGWNWKPGGCDGTAACKATCRQLAVHAEQSALLQMDLPSIEPADLLHVKTVDGVLVPSGEPSCVQCSKLLLASGSIVGVWLYHADGWRRYDVAEFHQRSAAAVHDDRRAWFEKGFRSASVFWCYQLDACTPREADVLPEMAAAYQRLLAERDRAVCSWCGRDHAGGPEFCPRD